MSELNVEFINELKRAKVAVVGLGLSGTSVLRFMARHGIKAKVFDSRLAPPIADKEHSLINQFERQFGQFKDDEFLDFDYVIVSPGLSLKSPALRFALQHNDNVFCDVELFARINRKPVVAVTGSNGKSTVVAWLENFLNHVGINAVACGNYGVPVMDVLEQDYQGNPVDLYVMELSSFQLESTHSLQCEVATVLNVTPDHMDRYDNMSEYSAAKLAIYRHAGLCLYNSDDFLTKPLTNCNQVQAFGTCPQQRAEDYWNFDPQTEQLMVNGQVFGKLSDLALKGSHNGLNALVVSALASAVGIDIQQHFQKLSLFRGLPHRCQLIAEVNGIRYIDDSKATNVASTLAALSGLDKDGLQNIVLIAGGEAKGADLSELGPAVAKHVRKVIAFGKDKLKFAEFLRPEQLSLVNNMQDAVQQASSIARSGDIVLLSPACASIDMYTNYQQRGEDFKQRVFDVAGG